jgi:hypothetical protein
MTREIVTSSGYCNGPGGEMFANAARRRRINVAIADFNPTDEASSLTNRRLPCMSASFRDECPFTVSLDSGSAVTTFGWFEEKRCCDAHRRPGYREPCPRRTSVATRESVQSSGGETVGPCKSVCLVCSVLIHCGAALDATVRGMPLQPDLPVVGARWLTDPLYRCSLYLKSDERRLGQPCHPVAMVPVAATGS